MVGFQKLSAEEVAERIQHNDTVACSGFTPAGCVKAIPLALARRAERLHQEGRPFQIRLLVGGSTNDAVDGALSRAHAVKYRAPFQSSPDMRAAIDAGEIDFCDVHLSQFESWVRRGIYGPIDVALVEVADYQTNGELTLTLSVGATATFCQCAKRIFLEKNTYHAKLRGVHDIVPCDLGAVSSHFAIQSPSDRIGQPTLRVDPKKICGVVETCFPDGVEPLKTSEPVYEAIGHQVADFLHHEMQLGRIPATFLPVQSGVGNIANGVLRTMGADGRFPPFAVYSEIAQEAVVELLERDRVTFVSACGLLVTHPTMQRLYQQWDCFKDRILLRPQSITNAPAVIQRLGILSCNGALEADMFGNVNSSHVGGVRIMNGIGGAGDFVRNSYISMITLPSTAKNGAISTIVPLCSHIDHTEHDVQVIVTEQGWADLRGKSPRQRAMEIIHRCVHPDYRSFLCHYLEKIAHGHVPLDLRKVFALYEAYANTGDMRNACG